MESNAEAFARLVHKGQKYGNDRDYCDEHLFNVVRIARAFGNNGDPDIESVAWLHDTIEDTTINYYDLIDNFGHDIARDVMNLTREGDESDYINKLRIATKRAKLVKLVDILVNLSNLTTYKGNRDKYAWKKLLEINACLVGLE